MPEIRLRNDGDLSVVAAAGVRERMAQQAHADHHRQQGRHAGHGQVLGPDRRALVGQDAHAPQDLHADGRAREHRQGEDRVGAEVVLRQGADPCVLGVEQAVQTVPHER